MTKFDGITTLEHPVYAIILRDTFSSIKGTRLEFTHYDETTKEYSFEVFFGETTYPYKPELFGTFKEGKDFKRITKEEYDKYYSDEKLHRAGKLKSFKPYKITK